MTLAARALKAASTTLAEQSRYGRLLYTGSDGTKVYRDADEDPDSYLPFTSTTVAPDGRVVLRCEYRAGDELPGKRYGGYTSTPIAEPARKPAPVPDWAARQTPVNAPPLPTVRPKSEGDPEVFVHTVRAGLGERQQLALILADSSQRSPIPRFAELFAEWSRRLFALETDQPADVVLEGRGFGWGHKADRAELERLLRIARDRQGALSPSMNALHRAAAIAYERDGKSVLIEPPEPERYRTPGDVTSTLQRML